MYVGATPTLLVHRIAPDRLPDGEPSGSAFGCSHFRREIQKPPPPARGAGIILKMPLKARTRRSLFLAPALHRRRNAHRLPIFGDGAASDLSYRPTQPFHNGVVGEPRARVFGIDQLLDSMTDRFRG